MPTPGPNEDRTKLVLGRLKARRGRITFTYVLTFLENIFELMYPWAIGIAVNGLLIDKPEWVAPFIAIWLAHIFVGGMRQLYDTRLFSRLYANMATDIVMVQSADGEDVSEVSARVEMAHEYVEFFEEELPYLFTLVIGLVGSVVLLFFYDLVAGAIMAGLMVPIAIINALMGRRALKLNAALNDQSEQQVDVVAKADKRVARVHFGRLAQWRIRLSNVDVASWTFAECFTLVATIGVLYQVASQPGALAGDIFASLAYVLRIIDNLDEVPRTVQQVGRLIDIRRRIRTL